MPRRRFVLALSALGALLLYLGARGGALQRMVRNIRACSAPSAGIYDAFSSLLMGGFYKRVAEEVGAAHREGTVLDVGCGPGVLAVGLAQTAPGLTITGLDIDPAMVARATARAERAGVKDRVHFEVGDVAALPFPDEHFDVVASTFSLHHWADPRQGLTEVHRVLKPGGEAYIYDVADWATRLLRHGTALGRVVPVSSFRGGAIEPVRWPGPFAAVELLRLKRDQD